MDFAKLLAAADADSFHADPRPGWAGPALLFGASHAPLSRLPAGVCFLAAGIPFDGTASSRPGASEGPAAIRQASLVYSSYIDSLGEHEMYDMRRRETFRYQRRDLVDAGDLHVYPSDPMKTFLSAGSEVRTLAATGATLLLMGGDHSITFPAFAGWQSGMRAKSAPERLGYVQVDHHFDFGEHSALHGPLYHGSNARRISELPGMAPERMAFVGTGSVTRLGQLQDLQRRGFHIVPVGDLCGASSHVHLEEIVSELRQLCDAVYVSIDIDVADCSVTPGTGNVTIGGLFGGELFDVFHLLNTLPIGVLDVVEVAPRYDPAGRTAHIAARLLFEFLYRTSDATREVIDT